MGFLVLGGAAGADEAILPTHPVSELLGEAPLGLDLGGARLWNGSLAELAQSVAEMGQPVSLGDGVDAGMSVNYFDRDVVRRVVRSD